LTNDLMVHQRVHVFLPGEAEHAALRDRLNTDKPSHPSIPNKKGTGTVAFLDQDVNTLEPREYR
jgi:hypothetical protein